MGHGHPVLPPLLRITSGKKSWLAVAPTNINRRSQYYPCRRIDTCRAFRAAGTSGQRRQGPIIESGFHDPAAPAILGLRGH